jgi:hypothetical protein
MTGVTFGYALPALAYSVGGLVFLASILEIPVIAFTRRIFRNFPYLRQCLGRIGALKTSWRSWIAALKG